MGDRRDGILPMITHELWTMLHQLNKAEKLRVVQVLVNELADDEEKYFTDGSQFEIWSPFDSADAAHKLMQMLDEDQRNNG